MDLMSILISGEYWASLSMNDFGSWDPYAQFSAVRNKIYSIVLAHELAKQQQILEQKAIEQQKQEKESQPSAKRVEGSGQTKSRRKKKPNSSKPTAEVKVVEYTQSPSNYRSRDSVLIQWTQAFRTTNRDAGRFVLPSVVDLRSSMEKKERQKIFLWMMNSYLEHFLLPDSIEEQFVIPCAVLRSLLVRHHASDDSGGGQKGEKKVKWGGLDRAKEFADNNRKRQTPVFHEWEFDALLMHVIECQKKKKKTTMTAKAVQADTATSDHRSSSQMLFGGCDRRHRHSDSDNDSDKGPLVWSGAVERDSRKRVICLGALFQVGLHHALMANEVCFFAFPALPPACYFDGEAWFKAYSLSANERKTTTTTKHNNDKPTTRSSSSSSSSSSLDRLKRPLHIVAADDDDDRQQGKKGRDGGEGENEKEEDDENENDEELLLLLFKTLKEVILTGFDTSTAQNMWLK